MSSKNTPLEIRVGDVFAGLEVRAISDAAVRSKRVYEVVQLCCGAESTMSHSRITRRRLRNDGLCKSCSQREYERKRAEQALAKGAVRDGFGHVWQKLGAMGPRWAVNEPFRRWAR